MQENNKERSAQLFKTLNSYTKSMENDVIEKNATQVVEDKMEKYK